VRSWSSSFQAANGIGRTHGRVLSTGVVGHGSFPTFQQGEHPEAIAMKQDTGRAILLNTVIAHLTEALMQGRSIDMTRFGQLMPSLTKEQWDSLDSVAVHLEKYFKQKDVARAILGHKVDTEFGQKTKSDRQDEAFWYERIRLFRLCRCIGFEPTFAPSARLQPLA